MPSKFEEFSAFPVYKAASGVTAAYYFSSNPGYNVNQAGSS
jgi:hypothetical protein